MTSIDHQLDSRMRVIHTSNTEVWRLIIVIALVGVPKYERIRFSGGYAFLDKNSTITKQCSDWLVC